MSVDSLGVKDRKALVRWDAFLIALEARNPDPKKPIRIAFEFNIARNSGQNIHNIRLEGRAAGPIVVRCRGSFANDAVRKKADDFFAFLDENQLITDSPGITLEELKNKRYARLITLDGPEVCGCWTELVGRLSWFASVVSAFKTAPARE